jgi:hypothetical protein
VVPVVGSTHGHGFVPKKAGADVRYREFGCGISTPSVVPPGTEEKGRAGISGALHCRSFGGGEVGKP